MCYLTWKEVNFRLRVVDQEKGAFSHFLFQLLCGDGLHSRKQLAALFATYVCTPTQDKVDFLNG